MRARRERLSAAFDGAAFALLLTPQEENANCAQIETGVWPSGDLFMYSFERNVFMNSESSVKLIEEMVDLKLQQYAESQMRPTPEVARILHEKRETDRRRLDQIRAELA